MKKIISFLLSVILLFVGFIHNSTMVFAMQENSNNQISNNEVTNNICCFNYKENNSYIFDIKNNTNKKCINICISSHTHSINYQKKAINSIIKNKIIKEKVNNNILLYISFNPFEYKNLYSSIYPPYYIRNINNYSYHTLTKIVRSNI